MAGTQRLLAIAIAFSLAGIPSSAKPDALGIVMLADHASLGSQAASEGSTVYDGDRLSTEARGSLRLLIGEAMLYVTEQSSVIVHQDGRIVAKEFEAELVSGTAVISVKAGTAAEIVASSARVRPITETRGVVQVRLVGPQELIVFARQGPAQISYRGESETIAEGKSYRVLLNPSDDGASGGQGAKKSGKRNKALVLIAIGVGTAAGIALLWKSRIEVRVRVGAWRAPIIPEQERRVAKLAQSSGDIWSDWRGATVPPHIPSRLHFAKVR